MGFFDKVKGMIGIEDSEYDDDYYDEDGYYDNQAEEEQESYDQEDSQTATSYGTSSRVQRDDRMRRSSNVTDISSSKIKISIQEPLTYDDGPQILDDIMNRKIVILNLEMLEVDKKRQIFDFVSGGIYSLDGDVRKVTKDIFVIVPRGVEIDGKLTEQIQSKSMYQL